MNVGMVVDEKRVRRGGEVGYFILMTHDLRRSDRNRERAARSWAGRG